jgi:hypothetical protein
MAVAGLPWLQNLRANRLHVDLDVVQTESGGV